MRIASIRVFAALLAGLLCGAVSGADVTLKAGSFLPSNDTVWYPSIKQFVERVNETGKAHGLKLSMVAAGPRAMSPFEMGNAVKAGILDLAHIPGAFYSRQLPVADAQKLSTVPVQEQRTNGAFDYLRPIYEKEMNAYYLGRWADGVPFHLYLTKKIDAADLSGLRIRGSSIYQPLIEALDGANVTIAPGETYTALERGVVDGLGWPLWGLETWGWDKLLKYRVEPGFYWAEVSVLVNLDTWKKLTPGQRDVLEEAQVQLENDFIAIRERNNAAQRRAHEAAGIRVIELKGAERERFERLAVETGWADIIRKDPVHGPRVRELTTH